MHQGSKARASHSATIGGCACGTSRPSRREREEQRGASSSAGACQIRRCPRLKTQHCAEACGSNVARQTQVQARYDSPAEC